MNPLESAFAEVKRLEDEKAMLLGQLAEVELKIKVVTQSVHLLNSVYEWPDGDPDVDELLLPTGGGYGITDLIRQVFRSRPNEDFSPTRVRDVLAASGFEVKGSNPMATIHTILKRLVIRREIQSLPRASGTVYFWESEDVGDAAREITEKMRLVKMRSMAKKSAKRIVESDTY